AAIALVSAGLLLLVLSAGVSYPVTIFFSLLALLFARQARNRIAAGGPGRPGQARAAHVLAAIALGLSGVAALVWIILASNGITPGDLQDLLEREADRLRAR